MRKITAFNFITLNGFVKGPHEDISWHKHGEEEARFSEENLKSGNILLLGRNTYEMMANFWPSQMAYDTFPVVAAGMNKAEKIVFSRTLKKLQWENSRLISGNITEEIKKIKQTKGKDMTILGSGSILTQFTDEGLIDEYQIMVDPVAIGNGVPILNDVKRQINLRLISHRIFTTGSVLLCFQPIKY